MVHSSPLYGHCIGPLNIEVLHVKSRLKQVANYSNSTEVDKHFNWH